MKNQKSAANASVLAEDTANSSVSAPASSPPAVVTATVSGGAVTTIDIELDAGAGNAVFLRGNGGGLTWERGVLLACVNGTTWHWSGMLKHTISFKPLINDRIWPGGNDLTVNPGQKLEVKPSFA